MVTMVTVLRNICCLVIRETTFISLYMVTKIPVVFAREMQWIDPLANRNSESSPSSACCRRNQLGWVQPAGETNPTRATSFKNSGSPRTES